LVDLIRISTLKSAKKVIDKADALKLLINFADEIQERSYTLFEKSLSEEPKLEEYLLSLIWASHKLKLNYLAPFLVAVKPFYKDEKSIKTNKISPSLKRLI